MVLVTLLAVALLLGVGLLARRAGRTRGDRSPAGTTATQSAELGRSTGLARGEGSVW